MQNIPQSKKKSKIFTIYKITNLVNGKCYIGFDSAFPKRINQHLRDAKNGVQSPLCNDLRYYGQLIGINNSFTFECLYQSLDPIHCLKVMEPWFIEQYNSHCILGSGYNIAFGGEGWLSERIINIAIKRRKTLLREIKTIKKRQSKPDHRTKKQINSSIRKSKFREKRMCELGPFEFKIIIPSQFNVD